MTTSKPALLLLPNLLGDSPHHELFLPASVEKAVCSLNGLIAESESGGRRFLSRFLGNKQAHAVPLALLNKRTDASDLDFLLEPILKGERWGLVSDAGLPCIADPGHHLVFRARQRGVMVQAFVGPSSLMLGLMLSGLSAERFSFHGYLPKEPEKRKEALKTLEKQIKKDGYTQVFIETPYRNQHMLESLLEVLDDETLLAVASDLTLQTQGVLSQSVSIWKKSPLPNLEKKNAIFMLGRAVN